MKNNSKASIKMITLAIYGEFPFSKSAWKKL